MTKKNKLTPAEAEQIAQLLRMVAATGDRALLPPLKRNPPPAKKTPKRRRR